MYILLVFLPHSINQFAVFFNNTEALMYPTNCIAIRTASSTSTSVGSMDLTEREAL